MTLLDTYIEDLEKAYQRLFPNYSTWDKRIYDDHKFVELYEEYKNNNDMQAREKLIVSQLKMVYAHVLKFKKSNPLITIDVEDLIGYANQFVIESIDKYRPFYNGKLNKFPSFIRTWVNGYLLNQIKKVGNTVRLPANVIRDITNNRKVERHLAKNNQVPLIGEIYNIDGKDIEFKRLKNYSFDNLDGFEDNGVRDSNMRQLSTNLESILTPFEYKIFQMKYKYSYDDGDIIEKLPPSDRHSFHLLDVTSRNHIHIYYKSGEHKKVVIYNNLFIEDTYEFSYENTHTNLPEICYINADTIKINYDSSTVKKIKFKKKLVENGQEIVLKRGRAYDNNMLNTIYNKIKEKVKGNYVK